MPFLPVSKRSVLNYGLATLLLLIIGLVANYRFSQLLSDQTWVTHTHTVQLRLEQVMSLLKDAETAHRGYLLTSDTAFLAPLRRAQPRLRQEQQALQQLTTDNPAQQRRLDTLRTLIDRKLALLRTSIRLHRPGAAPPLPLLRRSNALMTRTRSLADRLQRHEQVLLNRRRQQVNWSVQLTRALINGFILLVLTLAGLATWQTYQRTRRLLESRNRFSQLLETIPNMAWTSTPDGSVNYYNQLWYDYTGATFEQLAGAGWQHFVHPDDCAYTQATWQQALDTGQPITNLRNRWKCAQDGEYRWHLVRGVPLRNQEGAVVMWVGTNTDIHAQQLQQQELERVNQDLDTFVYTASHDLKTPIYNIEALLSALREELHLPAHEPTVAPLLTLMEGSVERFKRTIGQLTEVAKLQKTLAQPAVAVELLPLLDDVRQDLQPLLSATGGQLTIDVAACPALTFAPKNLRSVVYNLVSNALKYHHPDRPPLVQVRTYATGDFQVLEVADHGLGLELGPAQLQKLFGLFQRLHDHVEGTGIGLYMVKKLVENAGGHIEVESQLGQGTTFRVYLPAATNAPAVAA